MVLVLLSRFSHPWIDPMLVAHLSESSVAPLVLFGSISPKDLGNAHVVNEVGWAICSSLGSLVSHRECSCALAVCDAVQDGVASEGFVSCEQ